MENIPQESSAHLVLNKSKWHTPCVTSNLDIASAVLKKGNVHMMLKLIIRLCLNKTVHCQRRVPLEGVRSYFATKTQALGGSMA